MTMIVHHHVPGRTRLRLGIWPGAAGLARAESVLADIGMHLHASRHTGSVLVRSGWAHGEQDALRHLAAALAARSPEHRPAGQGPADAHKAPAPGFPDAQLDSFAAEGADAALERMGTRRSGLAAVEAAERLGRHGPNAIPPPAGRAAEEMVREQLATFPVALLAGSAALSLATGGLFDALVTLGVVAANTAIGFSSENATERLIRRLSRPVEHPATVLRDGALLDLPSREVVPGDVIVLGPNTVVSADARLLEANRLTVDESMLTGESLPVHKQTAAITRPTTSIAERHNLLHAGTVVTGGDGLAVALHTGRRTELARTREMIGLARPPRPEIEEQLEGLARKLSFLCLGASGLVLAIGLVRGEPLLAMVKSAIAMAVAAIPEGLPAVATTSLALGARQMEREQVYVRALPAIEALSGIDIICLDKTGTLTENHMAVVAVASGETLFERPVAGGWAGCPDEGVRSLAEAAALCNQASLAEGTGSATERALLHLAEELALDPDAIQQGEPPITVYNRNEQRRWMATQHDARAVMKGAPDEVLAFAAHELVDGDPRPIDPARRAAILAINERLARRGLRVLGVAQVRGAWDVEAPGGFVWLGLVGLADPVRAEAREAVDTFHAAGIRTIMITGDQASTALAVAEELALSRSGTIPVVEGTRLEGLDDGAVGELAKRTSVFARVGPADKLRIVRGLQQAGKRVAMIGDGVNDGPALRAASVGVAMGRKGTDVAREIADIVIADDDLRALARAIARARGTGDGMRSAIRFFLATNLSEMVLMLGESLHGGGELETPMELFWLNLGTDILPGLGLAMAEPRADVLQHPPRPAGTPLFDRHEVRDILANGGGMAAASLGTHFLAAALHGPGPRTRTATFLTVALTQAAYGWSLRDHSQEDTGIRRKSNARLGSAIAGSVGLMAAPLVVPPLRSLVGLARPGAVSLIVPPLLAGACLGLFERGRIISRTCAAAEPSPALPPVRTT